MVTAPAGQRIRQTQRGAPFGAGSNRRASEDLVCKARVGRDFEGVGQRPGTVRGGVLKQQGERLAVRSNHLPTARLQGIGSRNLDPGYGPGNGRAKWIL